MDIAATEDELVDIYIERFSIACEDGGVSDFSAHFEAEKEIRENLISSGLDDDLAFSVARRIKGKAMNKIREYNR